MDINRLRAVVYRDVVRTVYITHGLQDMDINRLRAVVYRHVVRTSLYNTCLQDMDIKPSENRGLQGCGTDCRYVLVFSRGGGGGRGGVAHCIVYC